MTCRLQKGSRAGTFVEMLVAISLSAIFLGAASLVLGSISANSKRLTRVVEADIGASAMTNFYNQGGSKINVYASPNFGKAAFANEMRDKILEDASQSSAIYVLPRSINNTFRPELLRYFAGDPDTTTQRPRLDTPEAFRNFFIDLNPTAAAVYDSPIRNVPATSRPNTTIYMLAPDANQSYYRVRAIYEIDFVTTTNISGSYASVRRYKNGSLTDYYDVFYDSGTAGTFHPTFVAFERESRNAVLEGTDTDRFKMSKGNPFYLVWLPDPAINPYQGTAWTPVDPAAYPRQAYEHMAAKSTFLIALPMFPNL